MLRHSEQWRFGVCWNGAGGDDGGTASGEAAPGVGVSVSFGTPGQSPGGQGGIGSDAVAGQTAGAPAATGSFGGGQSYGGQSRGGGPAAPSGGAAASTTGGTTGGAATGGGGGTAAGGSASGPGGAGTTIGGSGGAGGTGIGDIAAGFFSSIMGSPANAKSLYGNSGSAASYMTPQQIQDINKLLANPPPSNPFTGISLSLPGLSQGQQGPSLTDLANAISLMGVPSPGQNMGYPALGLGPSLGDVAVSLALGHGIGSDAVAGHTAGDTSSSDDGGDTSGFGPTLAGYPPGPSAFVGNKGMGYPAVEGVSPGLTAMPGPSQPTLSLPDLGGGPAGQTTGYPAGVGGADVGGGMPTGLDFGSTVTALGPPSQPNSIDTTNLSPSQTPYGFPSYDPSNPSQTFGGMPSPSSFGPSEVAQAIATQSPENAAISVAQSIENLSPPEQSRVVGFAIAQAQKTMNPTNYNTFVTKMLDFFDTSTTVSPGVVSPDPSLRSPNISYAGGV